MKKNKKKIFIASISLLVLVAILGLIYILANFKDKNSLTLEENKWIESNKHNVIDIAIMNDIPVLSYDGDGLIYDYLDYVTNEYSLEFNVIPNKLDNVVQYAYKMDIASTVAENDIVLFQDNLVLITADNKAYTDVSDITNLKIGVMASDKELVANYFSSNNIELVEYTNYSELKQALTQTTTDVDGVTIINTVDAIIIPKTIFTKELIEKDYKISFHINDLNKYFVLKATGANELNSILNKSFNSWKETEYETSYNSNLLTNYFKFKNITDIDQKKLQSKSYTYGFIDYGIYNNLDNNKISGLNGLILTNFNKFSGLSNIYKI